MNRRSFILSILIGIGIPLLKSKESASDYLVMYSRNKRWEVCARAKQILDRGFQTKIDIKFDKNRDYSNDIFIGQGKALCE